MTTLVDDIRAAKHEMMTRGRCTGDLRDEEGRVCLLGSIGAATIPNFTERVMANPAAVMHDIEREERPSAVLRELRKHLAPQSGELGFFPSERLWLFNDTDDTVDADAFNLFDKALADLGGL